MRYFAVIIVSAINVALVKASCQTDDGYTYKINATRIQNAIAPGYPVAYMSSKLSSPQNLTWFRSVGPDYPLMLESYLANGNTKYFVNDDANLLDTCANYTECDWPYLIVEIAKKSVLLDGDCSVEKGNYMIDETVGPITVNFPEMIQCGTYKLIFNGFVDPTEEDSQRSNKKLTWAFRLTFTFDIPDDGNCN